MNGEIEPRAVKAEPRPAGSLRYACTIRTGTPYHLAAHSAAVDPVGNVLLSARAGKILDLSGLGGPVFEGEVGQVFALKLDANGALRWCDRIPGAAGERAPWTIAADCDGSCFLAGETEEGTFLSRLDPAGKRQWSRRISSIVTRAHDRQPLALAVDRSGNALVLGHACEPGSRPSPLISSIFLLAFDPTGILLYRRSFPCTGRAISPRLALDGRGHMVLSGTFQGSITFGKSPLQSSPRWDLYVAKLDADGGHIWSKRLAGRSTTGFGAGADAQGNVMLGGAFQREIDVGAGPLSTDGTRALFLAKLDAAGRQRWARRYLGEPHSRFEPSLDVDDDGAIFAGTFEGALDLGDRMLHSEPGEESIFVVRLDEHGAPVHSRVFAGPRDHGPITAHAAPGRGAVVVGSFGGRLDLGGDPVWTEGPLLDVFVARLSAGRGTS